LSQFKQKVLTLENDLQEAFRNLLPANKTSLECLFDNQKVMESNLMECEAEKAGLTSNEGLEETFEKLSWISTNLPYYSEMMKSIEEVLSSLEDAEMANMTISQKLLGMLAIPKENEELKHLYNQLQELENTFEEQQV